MESLSVQIAFKTAKMVSNGAKRAFEMCQKHVRKDNHVVSKIIIPPITIASILQTHSTDLFVEQPVLFYTFTSYLSMCGQIHNQTCFVAAENG